MPPLRIPRLLIGPALVLVPALALGACDCGADDKVEEAIAISKAIKAKPSSAAKVLKEHDMTIEEFEELMYDIAADPELSERFEAAVGTPAE